MRFKGIKVEIEPLHWAGLMLSLGAALMLVGGRYSQAGVLFLLTGGLWVFGWWMQKKIKK